MAGHLQPAAPQLQPLEATLKIVQDQLTCGICLDTYTDPKVLTCCHTFCSKCLQQLVCGRDHEHVVQCPNCRQYTSLPQNGVSGLQSAFHIAHLFEIQDTLNKIGKSPCDKCGAQEASAYCRTCGFVCDTCKHIHQKWDELTSHQVISLDQLQGDVTRLVSPLNRTLYCSQHQGKELELFCEQCNQLICQLCTAKLHKGHSYDVVSDTFDAHKAELLASLLPVRQQLSTVRDSLQHLVMRRKAITDNQAALITQITSFAEKLIATVNAKKEALIDELATTTHKKLQSLSAQEDDIKAVQATLTGCLEMVEKSLQTGTKGEVLVAKKTIISNIRDLTANFQPSSLLPKEQADTRLAHNPAAMETCKLLGNLYIGPVRPETCILQQIPRLSFLQKETMSTLQILDRDGQKCECPCQLISCELVSADGTSTVSGAVKRTGMGQYELCYTAPRTGRYQLQVKVEGQHIQGSPFSVAAVKDRTIPIKTIGSSRLWGFFMAKMRGCVSEPWGVTISKNRHIIVAECGVNHITIFHENGEEITSFSTGQEVRLAGVAVMKNDSILVADRKYHRILKFSSQGSLLETRGKKGTNVLQFKSPTGIDVHPITNQFYIADSDNHRVQVLDANLNYITMFGSRGSENGQFEYPYDISFDRIGNCYVADSYNGRVQVFTKDGQFLRQFGKKGKGESEIVHCTSIAIDFDIVYIVDRDTNRISVFTTNGCFLTSFGTKGSGLGQFNGPCGICVDDNGSVYVSDYGNDRIQIL